jgi:hypothetical protein
MNEPIESQCKFTPCFRFTWPGNDEKYACFLHGSKLKALADVMGFHLQLIPLEPEDMESKQCNQKVKS